MNTDQIRAFLEKYVDLLVRGRATRPGPSCDQELFDSWDCCDLHKGMKVEEDQLLATAQQLTVQYPALQEQHVQLCSRHWFWLLQQEIGISVPSNLL